MRTSRLGRILGIGVVVAGTAACAGSDATDQRVTSPPDSSQVTSGNESDTTADGSVDSTPGGADEQLYPDVVDASAQRNGETWTFSVTVSSPYDSADRYADGWRILAPDGTELGFRLLTHDHANEQPFTRTLDGVRVPDEIDVVTIEGRDLQNGYGGATFELRLPA